MIILAGYDADINRLMSINPGLTSRFPETVSFRALSPNECLELFTNLLKKKKHGDVEVLESASDTSQREVLRRFEVLTNLSSWASAHDVGTIVKSVFGKLLRSVDSHSLAPVRLTETSILTALDAMIADRSKRAEHLVANIPVQIHAPMQTAAPQERNAPPPLDLAMQTSQDSSQTKDLPPEEPPLEEPCRENEPAGIRDLGVSDEVWARLQLGKQAMAARKSHYHELLADQTKRRAEYAGKQEAYQQEHRQEEQRQEGLQRYGTTLEEDEARRRLGQERLQRESERRQRQEELERLERELRAAEEERRNERAAQRKLRTLGVCVAGFAWIKQTGGYRCGGGSHYVSDAQLRLN